MAQEEDLRILGWNTSVMSVIREIHQEKPGAYLQNVLEITGGKFLHLRDVVVKTPYCKPAKCRNLAKSVRAVSANSPP